jgi:hypothetical protein
MQVFGLPSHITRKAGAASRTGAAPWPRKVKRRPRGQLAFDLHLRSLSC